MGVAVWFCWRAKWGRVVSRVERMGMSRWEEETHTMEGQRERRRERR